HTVTSSRYPTRTEYLNSDRQAYEYCLCAVAPNQVTIRALKRAAPNHLTICGCQFLADVSQPWRPVFCIEWNARFHLFDIDLRVHIITIFVWQPNQGAQFFSHRGLSRTRNSHENDETRN